MATVKVKFRKSSVNGKAGTVFYQICHAKECRHITTKIHLLPNQWDETNERVRACENDTELNGYQRQINGDLHHLQSVINDLECRGRHYSITDVLHLYEIPSNNVTVLAFFREVIAQNHRMGNLGTARNYERTFRSFNNFIGGNDIPFFLLDEELVLQYQAWLMGRGVVRNSISFYMRNLRSIYNKAVKRRHAEQTFPFANVYTGIDRTRKRAVEEDVILKLQKLDLSKSRALALARDLFVFSYFTRGMAFVDIAFLRKDDIRDGVISYVRHKTGQRLMVRIEPCTEKILRRWRCESEDSPYVFPILHSVVFEEAYGQYLVQLGYHNRKLKRIGGMLDEVLPLSSYTPRHTWATSARRHSVPISVISAGMGHSSEKTTQIYLATLENSLIDNANRGLMARFNKI